MNDNQEYLTIKRTKPYYFFIKKIKFPTSMSIINGIILWSLLSGCISFMIYSLSFESIIKGLLYGILGIFIPVLIGSILTYFIVIDDLLLTFRRCLALAFFSSFLWGFILILGAVINRLILSFSFPMNAIYFAILIIPPLRMLSIHTLSSKNTWRKFASSFIELVAYLIFSILVIELSLSMTILLFIVSVSFSTIYMLTVKIYIERKGKKQINISPILLFRGFLQELLENKNEIIEHHLEKLSITEQIRITIIKFRETIHKSIRTALVIANYHPGPLLTIGSSALPSKIQKIIQDKFGFPILVPHGISGHERNLVSQTQNEKVISKVIQLLDEKCQWGGITKPVEVKYGNATAHCQILNNCALTTLTLAPNDVEDIPVEVEDEVFRYSKKFFKNSILIDAHNSISKTTILSKQDLTNLITAAKIAIRKASIMKEYPFRIGIAKIHLNDFQLKQGIGPGEGFILLLEIDHNYFSYIIIDGNNMIKGLREQVHEALRNISINPVETMTTDTHIVSGLISSELGYFPVGAAISNKDLINRILKAANNAKQSLIEVETSHVTSYVEVKTLGLEFFSKLVSFMYSASRFIAFSTIPLIIFSVYIAYLLRF